MGNDKVLIKSRKPKSEDNSDKELVNWIDTLKSRVNSTLKTQDDQVLRLNNDRDEQSLRNLYRNKIFDPIEEMMKNGPQGDRRVTGGKGLYVKGRESVEESEEEEEESEVLQSDVEQASDDDVIEILSEHSIDQGDESEEVVFEEVEEVEEEAEEVEEEEDHIVRYSAQNHARYHLQNGRPRLSAMAPVRVERFSDGDMEDENTMLDQMEVEDVEDIDVDEEMDIDEGDIDKVDEIDEEIDYVTNNQRQFSRQHTEPQFESFNSEKSELSPNNIDTNQFYNLQNTQFETYSEIDPQSEHGVDYVGVEEDKFAIDPELSEFNENVQPDDALLALSEAVIRDHHMKEFQDLQQELESTENGADQDIDTEEVSQTATKEVPEGPGYQSDDELSFKSFEDTVDNLDNIEADSPIAPVPETFEYEPLTIDPVEVVDESEAEEADFSSFVEVEAQSDHEEITSETDSEPDLFTFKTVTEEDPTSLLQKLKETEQKFGVALKVRKELQVNLGIDPVSDFLKASNPISIPALDDVQTSDGSDEEQLLIEDIQQETSSVVEDEVDQFTVGIESDDDEQELAQEDASFEPELEENVTYFKVMGDIEGRETEEEVKGTAEKDLGNRTYETGGSFTPWGPLPKQPLLVAEELTQEPENEPIVEEIKEAQTIQEAEVSDESIKQQTVDTEGKHGNVKENPEEKEEQTQMEVDEGLQNLEEEPLDATTSGESEEKYKRLEKEPELETVETNTLTSDDNEKVDVEVAIEDTHGNADNTINSPVSIDPLDPSDPVGSNAKATIEEIKELEENQADSPLPAINTEPVDDQYPMSSELRNSIPRPSLTDLNSSMMDDTFDETIRDTYNDLAKASRLPDPSVLPPVLTDLNSSMVDETVDSAYGEIKESAGISSPSDILPSVSDNSNEASIDETPDKSIEIDVDGNVTAEPEAVNYEGTEEVNLPVTSLEDIAEGEEAEEEEVEGIVSQPEEVGQQGEEVTVSKEVSLPREISREEGDLETLEIKVSDENIVDEEVSDEAAGGTQTIPFHYSVTAPSLDSLNSSAVFEEGDTTIEAAIVPGDILEEVHDTEETPQEPQSPLSVESDSPEDKITDAEVASIILEPKLPFAEDIDIDKEETMVLAAPPSSTDELSGSPLKQDITGEVIAESKVIENTEQIVDEEEQEVEEQTVEESIEDHTENDQEETETEVAEAEESVTETAEEVAEDVDIKETEGLEAVDEEVIEEIGIDQISEESDTVNDILDTLNHSRKRKHEEETGSETESSVFKLPRLNLNPLSWLKYFQTRPLKEEESLIQENKEDGQEDIEVDLECENEVVHEVIEPVQEVKSPVTDEAVVADVVQDSVDSEKVDDEVEVLENVSENEVDASEAEVTEGTEAEAETKTLPETQIQPEIKPGAETEVVDTKDNGNKDSTKKVDRKPKKKMVLGLEIDPEVLEPVHSLRDGHKFGETETKETLEFRPEDDQEQQTKGPDTEDILEPRISRRARASNPKYTGHPMDALKNQLKKKESKKKEPKTLVPPKSPKSSKPTPKGSPRKSVRAKKPTIKATLNVPVNEDLKSPVDEKEEDNPAHRTRSKSPLKGSLGDLIQDRPKRTRKRKAASTQDEVETEENSRGRTRKRN